MKKNFSEPEMEMIRISNDDVIVSSGCEPIPVQDQTEPDEL